VSFFMLTGAVSFPLYYRARRDGIQRFFQDPQLLALVSLVGLASVASLVYAGWRSRPEMLVEHLFHAVSSVTTTGFNVTDTNEWPEGFRISSVVLMVIGGSAGSTAGGIKLVRLLLVARVIGWTMIRALLPQEAKVPVRHEGQSVTDNEIRDVLGFLGLYVTVLVVSTLLLAAGGFAPMDSLFEATSALGTVGLSTGITSAAMPVWAKLLLIVDMWAGRLEILPVLVFFYPGHWRSK
jgi:trk system potassium uptake protein TrkH